MDSEEEELAFPCWIRAIAVVAFDPEHGYVRPRAILVVVGSLVLHIERRFLCDKMLMLSFECYRWILRVQVRK